MTICEKAVASCTEMYSCKELCKELMQSWQQNSCFHMWKRPILCRELSHVLLYYSLPTWGSAIALTLRLCTVGTLESCQAVSISSYNWPRKAERESTLPPSTTCSLPTLWASWLSFWGRLFSICALYMYAHIPLKVLPLSPHLCGHCMKKKRPQ